MAAENDSLQVEFGDGEFHDLHRCKDFEADEVFDEAMDGGDEKVRKTEGMVGNENADDGHEIETFEEAMDRPAADRSLGDGDIVVESKLEEDVSVLDSAVVRENAGAVFQPIELNQVQTDGVIEKGEGDASEASVLFENNEIEKSENGEMNSGESLAGVREMAENDEEIENDSHRQEKFEENQSRDDGAIAVEEKIDDIDVSGHVDEDRDCSEIGDEEDLKGVSPPTKLSSVTGKGDRYAVMEVSAVLVEGKEVHDERCADIVPNISVKGVLGFDEKSENGNCDEATLGGICAVNHDKSENGDTDEVKLGEIHKVIHKKLGNGVFDEMHSGELSEQIQPQDESPEMENASSNTDAFVDEVETSQVKTPPLVGVLLEGKEVSGLVHKCSAKGVFTVDEKFENGNSDEVIPGEISAGVHEKSENGNTDEVKLGEINFVIHKKPGNGIFHKIESGELSEHQDESPEMKDTSGNMASSVDAEMETPQGKKPPQVGGLTELNEKNEAEIDESEAKDWQDSQTQLSIDAQKAVSNHSEVTDRTKELRVTEEIHKQDNGQNPSFGEKSSPTKLLERDFISLEEYDASSSTDEDDNVSSIQHTSVVSDSSGNSLDPPAPPRPAGLGSSASLLEPAPRVLQQSRVHGTVPQQQSQLMEDRTNGETEEYDETREKLQMIRVKFLRLARRLGQTPHNVVVAQVLYRLGLAEQLRGSRNPSRVGAFNFDRASAMAEQLEAAGQEPLDFSCTIMVIGKTGVGKSATINSIFDEIKFSTDAFQLGTRKVQDIVGMVQGIKVRVIDTPGLLSSSLDQHQNKKILHSVKHFIKKTPPDIVLYLDRLDMQSRDHGDVPLLRTITDIFGPSIWFNAIVVLTHAASAPPDGPNGTPLSYEMFVTQRSHVVQQAIRQAAGDMRLMNPVSLVENHSACRTNRAGQRVLPNGQVWKPHLLLLSFASKILAEANTLLKLQDSPPGKPFGTRAKIPPLPFLLSSLLQSRPQLKLPEEQFGDEETMDDDLDEASDSDDESEYDELPPFQSLTKAQLAKLSKEQKRAYFDELDYRENLFMKKQLKEEKKRRKLLKKMAESAKDSLNDYNENLEEESGGSASVPMPDMPLPSSFDSDNPTHRYRYLDNSNQWLVRPVLETHGWDHDVGYEGINVERLFVVKDKIPVSFSGQVTKDKKESNLQMELASSIKHGVGKATSFSFDMQTVGKDMSYTLRSDLRFSNFRCNKTAAGISVNILGDALSAGVKLEDILLIHKRLRLVMTGGAMTSRGDMACGGTLEATLRDKDYPLGRMLSTLGLSIMDWHGDLAIGCNLQSQFPVGRTTNMITRASLNNKGAGQLSIRLNSSEQLQIALVALIPVFQNIFKNRIFGSSQPMY